MQLPSLADPYDTVQAVTTARFRADGSIYSSDSTTRGLYQKDRRGVGTTRFLPGR